MVDEDPADNGVAPGLLWPWPGVQGDAIAALPVDVRVQVLYGPRKGPAAQGATVWWTVRVLSNAPRDRVGWMAEADDFRTNLSQNVTTGHGASFIIADSRGE